MLLKVSDFLSSALFDLNVGQRHAVPCHMNYSCSYALGGRHARPMEDAKPFVSHDMVTLSMRMYMVNQRKSPGKSQLRHPCTGNNNHCGSVTSMKKGTRLLPFHSTVQSTVGQKRRAWSASSTSQLLFSDNDLFYFWLCLLRLRAVQRTCTMRS